MHLQIKPGLRHAWRSPSALQIGLDPRLGTVLDGLTEADRPLIAALLSGVGATRRSTQGIRERTLVRLLDEAGVLLRARAGRGRLAALGPARARLAPDAAAWALVHPDADGWEHLAARGRRTVRIVGAGRTGTTLATTLACAGIGTVDVRDAAPVRSADVAPAGARPQDVGRPRQDAAQDAVARLVGTPERSRVTPAAGGPPADLVVLVETDVADPAAAQALVAADIAHLSVVIGEATIAVGPLVVPGHGSCLRCLDLHRTDRDPAWPRVLAQLLTARGLVDGEPGQVAEETASAQLAASLAALQVLGHLDGVHRPAALSATLEVDLPDGLISRREWPVHASCGCHWPPLGERRTPQVPGRETMTR